MSITARRFDPGHFVRSFRFAFAGFSTAFRTQPNFRLDCLLGIMALLTGVGLGITPLEWLVLLFTITLVLVSESLNSAIEATVDIATNEQYDGRAKHAKDMAAAACLMSACAAFGTAGVLFVPRLWQMLF